MHPRTALLVAAGGGDAASEGRELCDAAGYAVAGTIEGAHAGAPRYGMREGALARLERAIAASRPDVIVYNDMLRPSQNYNLASRLRVRILDREALILEIFERRASSDESRLQVRLAQLRYEMSRARERVRLAKMGEQPGFMGIGRYEVDVYYNDIRHRMESVRAKLRRAGRRRQLHRSSRERLGLRTISLAGYTSAGKTTLFNRITGERKEQGDGLFTTLSTTVRRASLAGEEMLVSDTVGFIGNLPAYMIEAFRSTLEEMVHADAILLIVDASDPAATAASKLRSCRSTLAEIGVQPGRIVTALNKADLVGGGELDALAGELGLGAGQGAVRVSAATGTGMRSLESVLARAVARGADGAPA